MNTIIVIMRFDSLILASLGDGALNACISLRFALLSSLCILALPYETLGLGPTSFLNLVY